jgi:hypothetical protein
MHSLKASYGAGDDTSGQKQQKEPTLHCQLHSEQFVNTNQQLAMFLLRIPNANKK